MREINTRYGVMRILSERDLISQSLIYYGEWAGHELDVLNSFIESGDCVLDVGAFIGTHSRAFSKSVGEDGRVLSFEPNPDVLETLDWNRKHAEFSNIRIYGVAVGAQSGEISLEIASKDNWGASRMEAGSESGLIVSMLRLDDLNLDSCHFIKLDVEGAESDVLQGAKALIERCRPKMFFELNSLHDGANHITWASDSGYLLYGLISDAYRKDNWCGQKENRFGRARECGILAIPIEQCENLRSLIDHWALPEINRLDDMVLLLLHKPQYPYEVLADNPVSEKLGLNYGGQLVDKLEFTLSETRQELLAIIHSRSWRITAPLRLAGMRLRHGRSVIKKINPQRLRRAWQLVREGRWESIYSRMLILARQTEGLSDVNKSKTIQAIRPVLEKIKSAPWSTSLIDHESVDIVVPVYNGWEHLARFFDALWAHTSLPYRLWVIDDASTDVRVHALLKEQLSRFPQMQLLTNVNNLGFVRTVNRGMELSTENIVLLNTDVEVPPNWIERLLEPMKSAKVASVTPFTNSGTICSFPVFCEDNNPLYDLDVSSIDQAFSMLHPDTIDIPTGVGFCMALARNALDSIGYFDSETFGRGYGEENDWCIRAARSGFRNVICNNLYVYHAHGGSFEPSEKKRLQKTNLKILNQRYPDYDNQVRRFIKDDPSAVSRDAAWLLLTLDPKNKPVLIFDHNAGGGANHYRELRSNEILSEGKAVAIYSSDFMSGHHSLICAFKDNRKEWTVSWEDIECLVKIIEWDRVIYNNLVFSPDPLSAVSCLTRLHETVNLEVLVHDFYPVCPSYTLTNDKEKFCGVPDLSECEICISNHSDILLNASRDIHLWRDVWSDALRRSNEIICFSEDSVKHVLKAYPDLRNKIVVRPHDITHLNLSKAKWSAGGHLHVAVIGAINKHKGAGELLNFINFVQHAEVPLKITLIGYLSPDYTFPDWVTVTGKYHPNELPELIEKHGVNLVWIPSIWPETFSYVTAECMAMGIPIACYNLGAPAERIKDYPLGRVLMSDNPGSVYSEFVDLLAHSVENNKITVK